MAKLLIFGGTFDPVHNGHLLTARAAMDMLQAQRVVFVPANTSPHKLSTPQYATPSQHRLAMLQLAVGDDPAMEVSAVELLRPPPSYTIDTLAILRRDRPGDTLILLVGADQLPALNTWKEIDTILATTPIAILPRPGFEVPNKPPGNFGDEIWKKVIGGVLKIPQYSISATAIRRAIAQGQPVSDQIPKAVMAYIRNHRLYQK
ncbi:MAG: nicotinate (nicotinamide) nucleotide adenylyltransferase [Phycisphaerae bacterium]